MTTRTAVASPEPEDHQPAAVPTSHLHGLDHGPRRAGPVRRRRRRGIRPDQLKLVAEARAEGLPWPEIAARIQRAYRVTGLAAMRLAHSWSQHDAAETWNRRWPEDRRTFKNFSYWENWPNPTGFMPSLTILIRLAELYECAVADLVGDVGDWRHLDACQGIAQGAGSQPDADESPTRSDTALM